MNLTNYYDHKQDNRYKVFEFRESAHASEFKRLIEEDQIPYEEHLEEYEGQKKFLFGIHNSYATRSEKCNFLVHAKYRKRMIPSRLFAWIMLIITGAFVILAVAGYMASR